MNLCKDSLSQHLWVQLRKTMQVSVRIHGDTSEIQTVHSLSAKIKFCFWAECSMYVKMSCVTVMNAFKMCQNGIL